MLSANGIVQGEIDACEHKGLQNDVQATAWRKVSGIFPLGGSQLQA